MVRNGKGESDMKAICVVSGGLLVLAGGVGLAVHPVAGLPFALGCWMIIKGAA